MYSFAEHISGPLVQRVNKQVLCDPITFFKIYNIHTRVHVYCVERTLVKVLITAFLTNLQPTNIAMNLDGIGVFVTLGNE